MQGKRQTKAEHVGLYAKSIICRGYRLDFTISSIFHKQVLIGYFH